MSLANDNYEINVKLQESVAEDLIKLGEDAEIDGYELVDERQVDYDSEDSLDAMLSLASTGVARPKAKSVEDGTSKQDSQAGVFIQSKIQICSSYKI